MRVATIKPWPSVDEIGQAGCLDAGHFVIKLQAELAAAEGAGAVGGVGGGDRSRYDEWIEERQRPWDDPEPALSAAVCVAHVLSLIIHTVEGSSHSAGAHEMSISDREAKLFYNNGLRGACAAARPDVLLQRIEKSATATRAKRAGSATGQAGPPHGLPGR